MSKKCTKILQPNKCSYFMYFCFHKLFIIVYIARFFRVPYKGTLSLRQSQSLSATATLSRRHQFFINSSHSLCKTPSDDANPWFKDNPIFSQKIVHLNEKDWNNTTKQSIFITDKHQCVCLHFSKMFITC